MIVDVIAATGFVTLVAAGLACGRMRAGSCAAPSPPRRVQFFVSLGLGLSLLSGLSQRDLWPFADWQMMHKMMAADVRVPALVCADSAGSTFPVDYRAWAPLTEEELQAWIEGPYTRLGLAEQDSARATLLRMAEAARLRVRRGGHAAALPSLFGRWAASSHLLHPRRWNVASDPPAEACGTLRWVERRWNVQDVAAGHGTITSTTVWQYPASP